MIEKWESGEALAAHGATDHIKALGRSGTLAGPRGPSRPRPGLAVAVAETAWV
jgi:hypothetical protein